MGGTQVAGHVELDVIDVDGHDDPNDPADQAGVRHGEVTKAPDAENRARSEGRMYATLMALYIVTPAQVSGAASNEETASGTLENATIGDIGDVLDW